MNSMPKLTMMILPLTLMNGVVLVGCKSKVPAELTNIEKADDSKLIEQVNAALTGSSNFKFPDVQVAAYNGTIQLSGFVISESEKQSAETIAKSVPGILKVENKIALKR
jgi:hyperosmotically inducible protein